MNKHKIPVVVIFAPTASGKTALMKELFSCKGSHFILNAEVINADSCQVYKYMDIGTAKAEKELLDLVPHHLIDLCLPSEQFNVSDFVDMADKKCEEIYKMGKLPVVCGGTGFYIRNFLFGVSKTPESDPKIREELKDRVQKEGTKALYAELQKIDPQSALKIHPNDAYRICRALEVYYISGKTRTSFQIRDSLRDCYEFLFLILQPPREKLYERIRQRVDLMIESGLEKEINSLVQKGYNQNSPGMKAIGYSEWFESEYFKGNKDIAEIVENIKHHSCKYAKKQYTYIRDINEGIVIDYNGTEEDIKKAGKLISDFVKTTMKQK